MRIDENIKALCHDSRAATPGSMFFCLNGTRVNGASFAKEAIRNGAIALVAKKRLKLDVKQIIVPDVREAMSLMAKEFYKNAADEMRIVGIVGTNGKTTCAHILKHIFETAGEKVGVIGTLQGNMTTPDPIDLHRRFAEMHTHGIRTIIMEVTAHAIHFKKVAGIRFEAVIFTNITQDHLDFFGTFENYSNTKINFFLQNNSIKTAIVNTDNEFGQKIMARRGGNTVEYFIDDVLLFPDRTILNGEYEINLPARFNAENALGCITAAQVLGVSSEIIKTAIKSIPQISGRFNIFKLSEYTVVVDFAHTPDGLEKIILAVKDFAPKRIITVFGCGGNRDKKKRPLMGAISARHSDFTIITSDNPRDENPLAIIKQIEKGFRKKGSHVLVEDRTEAINFALKMAESGDIVIIAGKGGETHTEIGGKFIEYTDEKVIKTYATQVLFSNNAVTTTHNKQGV